jgi:hypothetical protein
MQFSPFVNPLTIVVCTSYFNSRNPAFCTELVFMSSISFSKYAAVVSLNNVKEIDLCNGKVWCFLCGTVRFLKYYLDELCSSKR